MRALDHEQIHEFKVRLRERALQLRGEIRQTLERSSDESHARVADLVRDAEDDSFSNLVVDLNFAEIARDAAELRRIDGALRRLNAATFGQCVDCAREIPLRRLEAEPTAVRCVACQDIYEKTHATGPTPSL
jgi:DnaK suppressor protein